MFKMRQIIVDNVSFRVNSHTANVAEVYLGMPTSYNLGLKINF